jgi:hypothetical protein
MMPSIEISDSAFNYLKERAEPLTDTTVTVFDKIVSEHKNLCGMPKHDEVSAANVYGYADCPSVKFTSVLSAKIASKPASQNYWNNILEDVIAACVKNGADAVKVRASMNAKVKMGAHVENGYRYVPAAGFSFQGLEAVRACRNILTLAEKFAVALDIRFRWQDNEAAAFPNKTGRLINS